MKTWKVVPILVFAAAPALAAQQPIDESRAAAPDGVVEVRNLAGSVQIIGWDQPTVRVTGTLGRGAERLELTGDDRTTRVRVVVPEGARDLQGSRIEVHVPTGSQVDVRTVSAPVGVDGVQGPVTLTTVSGGITVSGSPRAVTATSVSGEVSIDASTAEARVTTTSGAIRVRNARDGVEAMSTSGAIYVDADRLRFARLKSLSGSIHFDGDLRSDGSSSFESFSGTVQLRFPATLAADLALTTFSGTIESAFESVRQAGGAFARDGRGTIRFSTGGGGATIEVKSFSGDLRLLRR